MNNQTIKSSRLVLAEHAYRQYALDIEPGVTLQDLLRPEMWSNNTTGQLRPRDKVRVISKAGDFDCELIVKAILPGAGVIMKIDEAGIPGSPENNRLRKLAASVHAEEEAERRAEIEAAIGGKP